MPPTDRASERLPIAVWAGHLARFHTRGGDAHRNRERWTWSAINDELAIGHA